MSDLQNIIDQMSGFGIVGLVPADLIVDGNIHRFRPEGATGKSAWYVLFEFVSDAGDVLVSGKFGDWRGDVNETIKVKGRSKLSPEDKKKFAIEQKQKRDAAKRQRQHDANRAALRASKLFERLSTMGESDYLKRKKVKGYGLRYGKKGTCIVPIMNAVGKVRGLQVIFPKQKGNGRDKDYWPPGLQKEGCFFTIKGKTGKHDPVVLCEGYATGASIHQATGYMVVVAFDLGNLDPVAKVVKNLFPHAPLLVAADDDYLTTTPIDNPGKTKAIAVAEKYGDDFVLPAFSSRPDAVKWTDFNDLHVEEGIESVELQILKAAKLITDRLPPPPTPPSGDGNTVLFDDNARHDWSFNIEKLLAEFAIIYPTDTVFDDRRGVIASLSALRAVAGKGLVRIWQEHPGRRVVSQDNVLFDPAMKGDPETTVNLFRGWPIKPKAGGYGMILELLDYLCSRDTEVVDWIIKWAAYPLQNPGAKMRTAIIMHGPEGTGKNTFWDVIRRIYDRYSAIITQTELESQFNSWASGKMFIIGNEVVSRQEMYHQKGRLKNMITEPVWAINEKMLPVRMEENHANFVFLSNSIQPGTPDKDDRRYLVVWTPPIQAEKFYIDVSNEIESGGVEAFYHYLMSVDLSNFSPHSKPPMTKAKEDLIEAAMDSHERFWQEWRAGELIYPFAPCLTVHLYQAYTKWCSEKGERPARDAVFGAAMSKRVDRLSKRFGARKQRIIQRRFYFPPGSKNETDEPDYRWLNGLVNKFENKLEKLPV